MKMENGRYSEMIEKSNLPMEQFHKELEKAKELGLTLAISSTLEKNIDFTNPALMKSKSIIVDGFLRKELSYCQYAENANEITHAWSSRLYSNQAPNNQIANIYYAEYLEEPLVLQASFRTYHDSFRWHNVYLDEGSKETILLYKLDSAMRNPPDNTPTRHVVEVEPKKFLHSLGDTLIQMDYIMPQVLASLEQIEKSKQSFKKNCFKK